MMAGHGVAVLALAGRRDRAVVVKWLVAAGAATVPVLMLAVGGFNNRGPMAWLPLATWRTAYEFPVLLMSGSVSGVPGTGLFAGLVITLGLLGLARGHRPAWILGGLALVPPAIVISAGVFEHVYHPRYLLYTLAAWSILAAATLVALRPPLAVLLCLAIVALSVPAQLNQRAPGGHGASDAIAKPVAAILATDSRPGDGMVLQVSAGDWLGTGLKYYRGYVEPANAPTPTVLTCDPAVGCRATAPRLWVVCLGDRPDARACLLPEWAAAVRLGYASTPEQVYRDPFYTVARYRAAAPES
jgi:mannosyltransferase